MIRVLSVIGILALLVGLFVFGLSRGRPDRNIRSNYLGKAVPSFELPVYDRYRTSYGDTLALDTLKGTPLVINFWSPTCPPCYDEAPHLERSWQAHQDEVVFLGVHTRDSGMDGGRDFISQFDLSFPNVFDAEKTTMIDYGLFGLPETFFVKADGTLLYKHVGFLSEAILEEKIAELLQ